MEEYCQYHLLYKEVLDNDWVINIPFSKEPLSLFTSAYWKAVKSESWKELPQHTKDKLIAKQKHHFFEPKFNVEYKRQHIVGHKPRQSEKTIYGSNKKSYKSEYLGAIDLKNMPKATKRFIETYCNDTTARR